MKTHKMAAVLFLAAACVLAFAGCGAENSGAPYSAAVTPELQITGDVENELILADFSSYDAAKIDGVPAIPLLSVLDDAVPTGQGLSVFFAAPDGVMAQLPLSEIDEGCMLALSSENGWQFVSEKHPRQSRIRHMDKIVISADAPVTMQRCFRMIRGEDFLTLTYGQLFQADALIYAVLEGEAQMNDKTTNAYSKRALISLSRFAQSLDGAEQATALAYFGDGSQSEVDLSGYLEWRGNSADYIAADKKSRTKDILGIWMDAPEASITDIASIALQKAQNGKVMIIELDGVGYYNLKELGAAFLGSLEVTPMRTVMPSISNVALAAIVTGEMPSVNGITARGMRDMQVDDMFKSAADYGLDCAVVEGESQLIIMSIEQILNPDTNNDGYTDDEVQASALREISKGTEFIYVHFHGFDDAAHTYGPSSAEAAEKLAKLDSYVAELCANFEGTVIITADHGQHTTTDKEKIGSHGEFLPVDMTVPFIIIER